MQLTSKYFGGAPELPSASKEAGLAQEIRETFFKHLLLYTISVAYGHWASTASATALGVRSPSAINAEQDELVNNKSA